MQLTTRCRSFPPTNTFCTSTAGVRRGAAASRPGPGDIWMTRRRNKHSDWQEPTNLGCVLNTSRPTKRLRHSSRIRKPNKPGFFSAVTALDVSRVIAWRDSVTTMSMQAHWAKMASAGPGILVPEFSSPGRDTRIFIRKDGLEAFITSNRSGSLGNSHCWIFGCPRGTRCPIRGQCLQTSEIQSIARLMMLRRGSPKTGRRFTSLRTVLAETD